MCGDGIIQEGEECDDENKCEPPTQPSGLDHIGDFRFLIIWLVEADSPLPEEKWLKF